MTQVEVSVGQQGLDHPRPLDRLFGAARTVQVVIHVKVFFDRLGNFWMFHPVLFHNAMDYADGDVGRAPISERVTAHLQHLELIASRLSISVSVIVEDRI